MKEVPAADDSERFLAGASKYAAYLQTPEGRLRLDLTWANLQEFIPRATRSLHALDVGGGTGAIAIRLAQIGMNVTLLDSSEPMLKLATRGAQEAGIAEMITLKQGDAAQLEDLFPPESFDLILCHNILEYIEDPDAVLQSATRALRNSGSVISTLVRNQAGEVLKAAVKDGSLDAAERNLSTGWACESLYQGRVRLFSRENLRALLEAASLEVVAERGVRVASDYLPQNISRTDEYNRILELERKFGRRPELAAVARYTHVLAHRV